MNAAQTTQIPAPAAGRGGADEILVAFAESAHQNRLTVLVRIILAIPAHVVTMLVILGMETIVMFITWLIVLIAGRLPRALHEAIAAGLRYCIRFTGYLFLVTATYRWGLFGDDAPEPAAGTGWLGGNQPWRLVLSR